MKEKSVKQVCEHVLRNIVLSMHRLWCVQSIWDSGAHTFSPQYDSKRAAMTSPLMSITGIWQNILLDPWPDNVNKTTYQGSEFFVTAACKWIFWTRTRIESRLTVILIITRTFFFFFFSFPSLCREEQARWRSVVSLNLPFTWMPALGLDLHNL